MRSVGETSARSGLPKPPSAASLRCVPGTPAARTALAVCSSCPVRTTCLDHALTAPERFGVWGGTTAEQRGWDNHGNRLRTPAAA